MSHMHPLAIGAIVASLIAGLVSLLGLIISKEQKVSEFRQVWIDALRSEMAALISHANAIHGAQVAALGNASEMWKVVREDFIGINQAAANIRLRLNPKEAEAQAVLKQLEKLERSLEPGKPMDYLEMDLIEKDLVAKVQVLLKNEWMRVRKGEAAYRSSRIAAFAIVFSGFLVLLMLSAARIKANIA